MKCKKCNLDMERHLIDDASIPDGDGCANYYTEKYFYCSMCNLWFDENGDKCDKPEQGDLV